MSDAQRDILKMLSDNVINVDEAERLLRALNEGEQRKEEARSGRRGHHGHAMGSMFESIGETLADIGPMIKNTVEDVMTGVFGDELGDLDDEDFVDVEPVEEQYVLEQETHMIIVSDWKWGPRRGDLQVHGISGNACRIENENAAPPDHNWYRFRHRHSKHLFLFETALSHCNRIPGIRFLTAAASLFRSPWNIQDRSR